MYVYNLDIQRGAWTQHEIKSHALFHQSQPGAPECEFLDVEDTYLLFYLPWNTECALAVCVADFWLVAAVVVWYGFLLVLWFSNLGIFFF